MSDKGKQAVQSKVTVQPKVAVNENKPQSNAVISVSGGMKAKITKLEQEEREAMAKAKTHAEMGEIVASYVPKFDELTTDAEREAIFKAIQEAKADLEKVHITLSGRWIVNVDEDDYAIAIVKGNAIRKVGYSNRAIKVKKGSDDIGSFDNAKLACESLNIAVGSDSAVRTLQRAGYTVIHIL